MARSQTGVVDWGVRVEASARRISSLHSSSVSILSITTAKRFLYSGSGGSEVAKSIWLHLAPGGASGDRKFGSGWGPMVGNM